MHFKKILVPIDDSEHSKHATFHAMGLAEGQEVHVALLHCYDHIPMLVGGSARAELVKEYVAVTEQLFESHAKQLRAAGIEPALLIKEGDPGEVIVDEAQAGGYDLIIMGSRGVSDVEGILLGSTAHEVLQSAHCPVLLTR